MYAVIFRARIKALDDEYARLAAQMRELARENYGCLDFHALTEGDSEVAISYWPDLEAIRAWHEDPQHRRAQALGRERWYASYSVEITQVQRQYSSADVPGR